MLAGRRAAWMTRPYSEDLRSRVVRGVESGSSCRGGARTFGGGVGGVVGWSERPRSAGSVGALAMGGRLPRLLLGERAWLLGRLAEKPDVTLRELVAELSERGVAASYGSVWRLLDDEGISFKKKRA